MSEIDLRIQKLLLLATAQNFVLNNFNAGLLKEYKVYFGVIGRLILDKMRHFLAWGEI